MNLSFFNAQFYAKDLLGILFAFPNDLFFFTRYNTERTRLNYWEVGKAYSHNRPLLTGVSNGGGVEQIHARAGQR